MTLCLGVGIFLFLFFHEVTSLHPPSFHRNDFSTCSTHFILEQSPNKNNSLRRARASTHRHSAHACARGQRPAPYAHAHVYVYIYTRACYGVVQCLPVKNPTIYRRNLRREINDRLVSVHTSIDYIWRRLVKKSAPRLVLIYKEIAGLLKKMMMNMTRKSRNRV